MRKADLTKNHDWFEEQINWFMSFLMRVKDAQLINQEPIDINTKFVIGETLDKIEIVESSILRICALWESFVEEELIDCLNLDCSKFSEHLRLKLPKDMTRDTCAAALLGDRYLDFKSVGEIKNFAKKVLCQANNPFELIKKTNSKKIDEIYIIRNYLSHYSRKSMRALRDMYLKSHNHRNFIRPGNFLLSNNADRLVQYIKSFVDSSQQMRGIIT
jgi:hypothetical protein